MARRDDKRRNQKVRLDLSDLETNDVLMEDLQHYVGTPRSYIPEIWDTCVKVLRQENRIILTEKSNGETLDQVYTDFYNSFSETKFKRVVEEFGISVRRDGYRENVAQFLYDVFIILYPQVASIVDRLVRKETMAELRTYRIQVTKVHFDIFNNGFGETERIIGVDAKILTEQFITTNLLCGDGYEF